MISKITFPEYNGVISEASIFAKEDITKAAETVREALEHDVKAVKQATADYLAQLMPKYEPAGLVSTEDAVASYAASHNFVDRSVRTLAEV